MKKVSTPVSNTVLIDVFAKYGINNIQTVIRNASPAVLYEHALKEKGMNITSTGALLARSGLKTGRCPNDKRIVKEKTSEGDIWWSKNCIALSENSFSINRERAVDYLSTRETIYIVDGFAGWDLKYRKKIRLICSSPYHALFMHNMLIRPTKDELQSFGEPDYVIYNAGQFPANKLTEGMTSQTSVALNFKTREMVILGTCYAGEMKKGVFTIMNYLMPKEGVLSLHSSCNEGEHGDISVFFGLSGTGKTTLSADPNRKLIGDDEHVWSNDGVFNIEGGCYAKCINLSKEKEPEIFDAIRFGAVLENVVMDPDTRIVDYDSLKITENTRCAYPLEFIPNAKLPALGGHPSNVILLTCDAFGVLPPVSKLNTAQAMYWFINGYTSKVAGTEEGVKEPTATFSACFGEPFLVWHPVHYATLLKEKLEKHKANVWLINTGWISGSASNPSVKRIPLKYTRAMIDAIHNGELAKSTYETMPVFGLQVPTQVTGVPSEVLLPRKVWSNKEEYDTQVKKLATLFTTNFEKYKDRAGKDILLGGPQQ